MRTSLKQPRRRRRQERHKFGYFTIKNISFACFARAIFICVDFTAVFVLSTTWNDLFCSCVGDMSIWWQIFNIFLLSPNRWYKFISRIFSYFANIMTWINWEIIAETRSFIFRWRSRCRRRRLCIWPGDTSYQRLWVSLFARVFIGHSDELTHRGDFPCL